MAAIYKSISIDVAENNIFQSIIAKQFDSNSRYITALLTNEGKKIDVENTATVVFNALRPDNEARSFAGVVNDDGTVTVPITSWMLELDGTVTCDISVYGTNEEKLTTTSFTIGVEVASCSSDDISEDESYDILLSIINNYNEAAAALENKVDKVEGKGLSTNDYTDEEKQKLDNLVVDLYPIIDKTDKTPNLWELPTGIYVFKQIETTLLLNVNNIIEALPAGSISYPLFKVYKTGRFGDTTVAEQIGGGWYCTSTLPSSPPPTLEDGTIQFVSPTGSKTYTQPLNNNSKATTIDDTSTNNQLPTAKAVWDLVQSALYVQEDEVIV